MALIVPSSFYGIDIDALSFSLGFKCTQTVFKINTIIDRNISYLLMNFITWNESWNVQIVYIMASYIQSEEWKYWS